MIKIEYGLIDSAKLYIEDHSCFVLDVGIKLNGGGYVSFGGVSLGHRNEPFISERFQLGDPTNYGIYFISRVLKIFKVDSLDELKTQPCRVILDDNLCVGIMGYLDDNYFIPKNDYSEKNGFIDPITVCKLWK